MEKKELTNRDAVIIGLKSGLILMTWIFLVLVTELSVIGLLGPIVIGLPGIVTGIVGAVIAKRFAKLLSTIWVGGVFGAILGVVAFAFLMRNTIFALF